MKTRTSSRSTSPTPATGYFADARNWIDLLETVPGQDSGRPRLTRQSVGSEFTNDEWNGIVALRLDMLDAHNYMGEPDLISIRFSPIADSTILYTNPTSGVHGQGTLAVNWHAPNAGHHDWIALYPSASPNNGSYVSYQYVPDGQVDGTFNFAMPGVAGTYEFRYLVADSYVSIAVGSLITVT